MGFNALDYQNQVIKEIQDHLAWNQKLYLELVGSCIDQSDYCRLIPWFQSDTRKKQNENRLKNTGKLWTSS